MKITNNVYALDSTRGSYAYIILGKETILVDTGQMWQGKGILKELAAMNIKLEDIKHIVLTHHDLDHVGNAAMLQKLTKAKLWASSEDIPYIYGNKDRPGIKKLFSCVFRVRKPENIRSYSKDMKIGDIDIIPSPGHTPGHVCVFYKDVLFAGDLVDSKKGNLRPYPNMNWNEALLMKSIKDMYRIPFKLVCPAHGRPIERINQWEMM
jgi:glyoxylase-like metal-dependent hydrolase (beta-lactamase superfamily II)